MTLDEIQTYLERLAFRGRQHNEPITPRMIEETLTALRKINHEVYCDTCGAIIKNDQENLFPAESSTAPLDSSTFSEYIEQQRYYDMLVPPDQVRTRGHIEVPSHDDMLVVRPEQVRAGGVEVPMRNLDDLRALWADSFVTRRLTENVERMVEPLTGAIIDEDRWGGIGVNTNENDIPF